MNAFDPIPPAWVETAIHAHDFACPTCREGSREAKAVWVNRRSPVLMEDHRRKWQEFYQCQCGMVWWAWSSDRPPAKLGRERNQEETTE